MTQVTVYLDEEITEDARRIDEAKHSYIDYHGEMNIDDDPADYFHNNLKGRLIA